MNHRGENKPPEYEVEGNEAGEQSVGKAFWFGGTAESTSNQKKCRENEEAFDPWDGLDARGVEDEVVLHIATDAGHDHDQQSVETIQVPSSSGLLT